MVSFKVAIRLEWIGAVYCQNYSNRWTRAIDLSVPSVMNNRLPIGADVALYPRDSGKPTKCHHRGCAAATNSFEPGMTS
jgi:hypothetical protein